MVRGVAKTLATFPKGFGAAFHFLNVVLQFFKMGFSLLRPETLSSFHCGCFATDLANVAKVLPDQKSETYDA
jgi:hypothetical protein